MPREVAEVRRCLQKADRDRMGTVAALQNDPALTDIAAFHCQQAVEKTLKAYLVWREREFEKTHDLVELIAVCAQSNPDFSSLRASVDPLTPYAVRFRYPGPADPSVQEVRQALAAVRETWEFVLNLMPDEVRP